MKEGWLIAFVIFGVVGHGLNLLVKPNLEGAKI